jgi:hypothetical protein
MQPLDLRLTPRNEILRMTLSQLHQVSYYGFYYFVSFCWTLVQLGDFLYDSCFSDEFVGCRSNVVNFFSYIPHTSMASYVLQLVRK